MFHLTENPLKMWDNCSNRNNVLFCVGTAELHFSVSGQLPGYTVEKKNYNAHLNHIENAHMISILCDIWGLSHIADY